ncbi:MAG: sigma factor regulatory protein FecR [Leptospiraceae bacterium]|nr:MAG: sigma factor regulatory protein FecR [Leptospiraceae bacterium]
MKSYNKTMNPIVLKNNTTEKNSNKDSIKEYYIKIDSKKQDFIFLIISILILLTLSYLLYRDIYKSYEGIGKPIGTIVFKKRTALRKIKNQSIWEYLQNEYPVYNGDAIKTEEFSEAVLKLNDGTEIALNENTFIVLNFSDEETKIKFNYGSLEANAESNKQIKVTTKDSEIELTSANAKLIQNQNSLQIQLKEGSANLKKNNKIEKIKENEVALLDNNTNKIIKKQNQIIYLSPEDNERFITNQNQYPIIFSFKAENPNKNFELLIALNSTFRPVLMRIPIKNTVKVSLNPGTYYWKIIEKNSDPILSSYRKFTILKQEKPILYSPVNDHKYVFKDNLYITFSWSKLDLANSYEIWLDTNKNFTNPQKITTITNMISIPLKISNNKEIFYWKVIPKSSLKDALLESNIFSFRIERMETLKPAQIIFPLNETFYKKSLKKGLNFSWQYDVPNNQIFQIAEDREFKNIILSESKITNNFYIFKKELPAGTYYWRVINEDNLASNTGKFYITDIINIEILSPEENAIYFFDKINTISFRWKVDLEDLKYKIFIYYNNNILFNKDINQPYFNMDIQLLKKEGQYQWIIEVLNKNDNKKLLEKKSQFYIYYSPVKTQILRPYNNQTINLLNRNSILLQWKRTPYTDYYEYEIYKNGQLIYKNQTKLNYVNFNLLTLLGIGIFDLKVYSVKKINQKEYKSDPDISRFILEYKLNKKPEFLTPDKIIIE